MHAFWFNMGYDDEKEQGSTESDLKRMQSGLQSGMRTASNMQKAFGGADKAQKGVSNIAKKGAKDAVKNAGENIAKEVGKEVAKEAGKEAVNIAADAATGGVSRIASTILTAIKKTAEVIQNEEDQKSKTGFIVVAVVVVAMFLFLVPSFVATLTPASALELLADMNNDGDSSLVTWIKNLFPFISADEEVDESEYVADVDVEQTALTNKKLLDKRFRKAYKDAIKEARAYCLANGYSWRKSKNTLKDTHSASWKEVYEEVNYGYAIAALNLGMYETEIDQYESEAYSLAIKDALSEYYYEIEYSEGDGEGDAETGFVPDGDDTSWWESLIDALEMPYVSITIHYYTLQDLYMIATSTPDENYIQKTADPDMELFINNLNMQKLMRDQFKAMLEKYPETYNKLNLDNENVVWSYGHNPTTPGVALEDLIDLIGEDVFGDGEMLLAVPWYKQWLYTDPNIYPYGQGTIKSSGCCLMSVCMIGAYMTGKDFGSPYNGYPNMWAYYCDPVNGYVNSGRYISSNYTLNDFGIQGTTHSFSRSKTGIASLITELETNRNPIMIHYVPGEFTSQGHFSVITGYNAERQVFYTNDPGSSHRAEVTFDQMIRNANYYQTYAK